MAFKMSEFHGIDPDHVTTLRASAIENTDDLMKIWSDKTKRAGLVASTGIAEDAAMARLSQVQRMALEHVAALVAGGIGGPKRLFSHTPETLVRHLGELAAEKRITDPMPTLEEVTAWFANPRPGSNGGLESRPKLESQPKGVVVK